MSKVFPVTLTQQGAWLLDQTVLPGKVAYQTIKTPEAMADAIRTMVVRGAPAIGIAGAFGLVLSARLAVAENLSVESIVIKLREDAELLNATRPTAVNLSWALREMLAVVDELTRNSSPDISVILDQLTEKAEAILAEDIAANQTMGKLGAALMPKGAGILTHCNAGALATGGYGTALGVIRAAFEQDSTIHVYADETRPRLQGARLTTWELAEDGIPVTLVTDGMSGSLMKAGKVQAVITGADRIAANGDAANKIGTYNLALVAKAHNVPFYVAAPRSTLDLSTASGDEIPIEFREEEEVTTVNGERICAEGIGVYNPGFDVTPAELITGIITERGIVNGPEYQVGLGKLYN